MHERIVRDPAILGGIPVIKGTRMPVKTILSCLADGMGAADVVREYDHITADDVRACVEYAAEHLSPSSSPSLEEIQKAKADFLAEIDGHLCEEPYAVVAGALETLLARLQQHTPTAPPASDSETPFILLSDMFTGTRVKLRVTKGTNKEGNGE